MKCILITMMYSRFAELTAKVFTSSDIKVYLFSNLCPTPWVPFAIKMYGAAAGVMVTASHNPKEDNGYKVYWNNAAQITGPHDKNIEASIMEHLKYFKSYYSTLNAYRL
jgi:phosphoglucomutase / phosphopentomutase